MAASDELRKAFRDPEGIYYVARHFSFLNDQEHALEVLSLAINHGFFCYPAMVRDPWLDPIRTRSEFTALQRKANDLHREVAAAFLAARGDTLLGLRADAY